MTKQYLLSFFIYFLIHINCLSQENTKIHYVNPEIKTLLEVAKMQNNEAKITVYSIQLKASETPEKIRKIKSQYHSLFPGEQIDEIFEPPYFKIITGIYLDKKQAENKLQQIKRKFKSAFILKREIGVEKFKEYITAD